MALDRNELYKGIRDALVANGTITAAVGTRVYNVVPKTATLPMLVFVEESEPAFVDAVFGPPVVRIWAVSLLFQAFSQGREVSAVAGILKAVLEVMGDETNFSMPNHRVIGLTPSLHDSDFDESIGSYVGEAKVRVIVRE